ncbi:MAG: formate--tetrahydrofolate ligase [Acidobacteriota bacterium]
MPELRPIEEIADRLDIATDHLVPYGRTKGKVRLAALEQGARDPGKLVLVSALTPTDAGEGKTVTSIGLAQGLAAIDEQVCLALREPSLGPVFGMKGGATGGGGSTVEPQTDINLHFNGDFHAITSAHNLLAALLDNHLQRGNALGLDPRRITWPRVLDMNDRALRNVLVGLGGATQGVPRESSFDITPASEIMATLCLARDRADLRARLGRLIVGATSKLEPVTAAELNAVGSMSVLLKDALRPNLAQTVEGVPAVIHGGPFANIAHGTNSVIATRLAMSRADWTVTEAGFAFDLGGEKFFDLVCPQGGFAPAAVVLVATVRALKRHGGVGKKDLERPDPAAVERGFDNLRHHVESVRRFGRDPVIAINCFATDAEDELRTVEAACGEMNLLHARSTVFARGGEGGADLARAVVAQAGRASGEPVRRYADDAPFKDKLDAVARDVYGADGVDWTPAANRDLRRLERWGLGHLPPCVAKTQSSISDDPKRPGRPTGFRVTVRGVVPAAGAGFAVALLGDILRMPGLPKVPQAHHIDLVDGEIVGVS